MRIEKFFLVFTIFFLLYIKCWSQTNDSIFYYSEYIDNIIRYHPIAQKANLQIKLAAAERLAAKGNLDPQINSGWDQKSFDDKLYFRLFDAKLRIPTTLGVDIVGGYENTEGVFLNPENTTDEFGLWNAGIEADLIQGLWINERSTQLKQAAVFQRLAENEQQLMMNDLLYTATLAYLQWQQFHSYQTVLLENQTIANTYFQNTRQSFLNGEKTAMDTLEAYIMLQDASNLLQQNEVSLIKVRQLVENYLWFNENPIALQVSTFPEEYENPLFNSQLSADLTNIVNSHPIILQKINKQNYFEIEQRLKREKLKPKLKAKYNPLLSTSENGSRRIFPFPIINGVLIFPCPCFLEAKGQTSKEEK